MISSHDLVPTGLLSGALPPSAPGLTILLPLAPLVLAGTILLWRSRSSKTAGPLGGGPCGPRHSRLLGWLLRHHNRYAIIHACDCETMTPDVILKLVYGKRVVYDVFDRYADMVRGVPSVLRQGLARLDHCLLEKVDHVILAD